MISLEDNTQGQFSGIGIDISLVNDRVKIIAPIDDTPAQRAGIQSGDWILKINGQITKGLDIYGIVKLMRGKPGHGSPSVSCATGLNEPINNDYRASPSSSKIVYGARYCKGSSATCASPSFKIRRAWNYANICKSCKIAVMWRAGLLIYRNNPRRHPAGCRCCSRCFPDQRHYCNHSWTLP